MLKNHIMISEYKCPDFPFNTIVDELGTKKYFLSQIMLSLFLVMVNHMIFQMLSYMSWMILK